MPNISHITGLRPINQPYGGIRANVYEATTGTAFFMYQPVDLDANGRVTVALTGTASTTAFILGSIVGLFNDAFGPPDDAYSGYIPANPASINSAGLVKVLVADDPNQLFLVEEDTGGSALDAQSIGAGVVLTYTATTGNTTSGVSNAVIDRSTVATTTDLTVRLIKKWDKPDNAFGNWCKWVVQINRHRLNAQSIAGGTLI